MSISILHVAYVPALLQTRQVMLEKNGYTVISALGNDEAIALASSAHFDLAVVSSSAPPAVRSEMVRWLKQHIPDVHIVALLAFEHVRLLDVDCAVLSDSRDWLAAIADCVKQP